MSYQVYKINQTCLTKFSCLSNLSVYLLPNIQNTSQAVIYCIPTHQTADTQFQPKGNAPNE
ncbi:hypothetical protein EPM78_00435 [Neisseria gonorrhoeae]|uniref:Uncharacterized protein n=1 Tax=Neisseria gonorrhoeae TaxID=485 RepID=A0AAX2TSS3_NEIGO|nr:hypothetical protein A6J43_09280 [Neisseria gonorrhoeae]ARC01109.1 hypothetical protein A6J44_06470 [Neisseria gonorrhoeae]ARC04159.1 hypothetical protein A6J46_11180 [Neisseria gonorrhoeae]ASQ70719.1 hypothetical protein BZG33_02310 [Neisseria gonorrhoeae]ASQ73690.1 hypothetical protein BZG34_06425 [Neisseria gonorrhoeae]